MRRSTRDYLPLFHELADHLEARLVMKPDEAPADTQRWFWGQTALGTFLRQLRDVMNDSDDQLMRASAYGIAR